jgi:HTH-type transcriptional regulator / antitoxin HigA
MEGAPMSTTKKKAHFVDDDYLRLVRELPLKQIRNRIQLHAALAMLTDLTLRAEDLSDGEEDYRDALAILVHEFESARSPLQVRKTPLERLQFLVTESGMSVNDLGRIVGSQPMASLILSGNRELSKANIRALAAHFKVNPSYFL